MRAACTHTNSTTTACPRCGCVPCCEPAQPVLPADLACLAAAVNSMLQQSLQAPVLLLHVVMHCVFMHCSVSLKRVPSAAVQSSGPLCCRCTKAFYERRRLPKYMQDQPRKDPLAEVTQPRDKSAPSSSSGKPPSGRRNAMVSTVPNSLDSVACWKMSPATTFCLLHLSRATGSLAEGQA